MSTRLKVARFPGSEPMKRSKGAPMSLPNAELIEALHGLAADYDRILRCAQAAGANVAPVYDALLLVREVEARLPQDVEEEGVA